MSKAHAAFFLLILLAFTVKDTDGWKVKNFFKSIVKVVKQILNLVFPPCDWRKDPLYVCLNPACCPPAPLLHYFRCLNPTTCESVCRYTVDDASGNPCLTGEIKEISSQYTPFLDTFNSSDNYQNCQSRVIDYPMGATMYPFNDNKVWTINSCSSKFISISVKYADLDSGDYLRICNGPTPSTSNLLELTARSGTISPALSVQSNLSSATLAFSTDGDPFTRYGFVLSYSFVDPLTVIPTTTSALTTTSTVTGMTNFGGWYQVDDCGTNNVVNAFTNALSCPSGYVAYQVGRIRAPESNCGANQQLCLSQLADPLFGGAYQVCDLVIGNNYANPVTNALSCPTGYTDYVIGKALSAENAKIGFAGFPRSCTQHACFAGFGGRLHGFFQLVDLGRTNDNINNPVTGALNCPDGYAAYSRGRVRAPDDNGFGAIQALCLDLTRNTAVHNIGAHIPRPVT